MVDQFFQKNFQNMTVEIICPNFWCAIMLSMPKKAVYTNSNPLQLAYFLHALENMSLHCKVKGFVSIYEISVTHNRSYH